MIFKKEIQQQVSFELDTSKMFILTATAEAAYEGTIVGQIRKADFGVRFEPYRKNIGELTLKLLLKLNKRECIHS